MNYPETIKNLIECFKHLPGIGEKTAERLALSLLEYDDNMLAIFAENISNIKTKVHRCERCHSFCEKTLCDVCLDKNRNQKTICVVEMPKDVIAIEKIGKYNGTYHVLDGLISPINGKGPTDLNINTLLERIKNEHIKEVILVLTPSIEGETTSLYINKKIDDKSVVISKIAHGVPIGANMDYIDALTLEMALENRTILSES